MGPLLVPSESQGEINMNNPRLLCGIAAVLTLAAVAGCNEDAKQVAASQRVPVAREECHDEVITHANEPKDKNQVAGTVVGAVIGGVLGNQIGKGDGKKLATAGGAVAGGYAGNKIQENAQDKKTYTETKRVCKTVYE
jgi:uncharacterized protein YcfJ